MIPGEAAAAHIAQQLLEKGQQFVEAETTTTSSSTTVLWHVHLAASGYTKQFSAYGRRVRSQSSFSQIPTQGRAGTCSAPTSHTDHSSRIWRFTTAREKAGFSAGCNYIRSSIGGVLTATAISLPSCFRLAMTGFTSHSSV